ncbi:terminase large subunit [Vibrio phage 1.275.O._10N.286.54.E11]|nr:terminase large subunit [Vibrio phage 1.275.O._10N.286.54.E11]
MSSALLKRLKKVEPLVAAQSGDIEPSVYGIVDKINQDGTPNFIRKWKGTIGSMVETSEEPTIFLIEKLEPMILKHKKYKCMFGGRAGTKSIMAMDVMSGEINSVGSKVFCLREHMKSLKNSIYAGIVGRIRTLGLHGFTPVPSQWEIKHRTRGLFSFGGLQNVKDMKSSFNYKFFLLEEADGTAQETIDVLGPTLRGVEGAELWYIWNPQASNDPMSTEFITPYQEHIDRDGLYEDDHHLIIKVGFEDNPWFMHDQSLRSEYQKDKDKVDKGLMSKARFNHIWHGEFNDAVENSIIETDWFDACINAHEVLGFKGRGAKVATHDPADVGNDAKGLAIREGNVFYHLEEIDAANGNDGFDVACGIAIKHQVNKFGWDCDGMGALLRNQASKNFKGINLESFMFKGSEAPNNPKSVCDFADDYGIQGVVLNEDAFYNKRAQNYAYLANRVRKTYEAVTLGMYHNPDDLISFDKDMPLLNKLRSELCRIPSKPNSQGKIALYSKDEMKKGIIMPDGSKRKLPSPNLADCVMMSFDNAALFVMNRQQARIPRPLQAMGRK